MEMQFTESILSQKEPSELYDLVEPALESTDLRELLVEGCFAKNETYRYNCVRVFFRALAQQPGLFYPYWERFAEGISSPNGFFRSSSTQAIAFLTAVDEEHRLNTILEAYLGMLDDEKVMVARYFVQTIHLIPEARPDLRTKVIACLLDVENTRHTASRKSLLKADIINAFDRLFETMSAQEQKQTLAFAKKELDSESPSTHKAAKAFLANHQ